MELYQRSSKISRENCLLYTLLWWFIYAASRLYKYWLGHRLWWTQVNINLYVFVEWRHDHLMKHETQNDFPSNYGGWIHSFCISSTKGYMVGSLLRSLEVVPHVDDPVKLQSDNISIINYFKNSKFHGRTKHIEIKYHCIRENKEEVRLCYILTGLDSCIVSDKVLSHKTVQDSCKSQEHKEMVM